MTYDFDQVIDRRSSDSLKWRRYASDVLPLWVADMDFMAPPPVIEALHRRVKHGVFGYGSGVQPGDLQQVIAQYLARQYHWRVSPEELVLLPGVVTGFNLACRATASPGDGVLIQTPVYPPFLSAPENAQLRRQDTELVQRADGSYEIDFDAFERSIDRRTRLYIMCNPHNPVGRVFQRHELERIAQICTRNDVMICADEIHSDLIYSKNHHLPIASLDKEIARRTITLIAPSKTYNIPGLQCSVAIIPDTQLRNKFNAAKAGLVNEVNVLGQVAALAAYRDGQPWLKELLRYLQSNRDFLVDYVNTNLPDIKLSKPESTYLAWLDCRKTKIPGNPFQFFLEKAKVALSDGETFGMGGKGFVRLNFGCPRSILADALQRLSAAYTAL